MQSPIIYNPHIKPKQGTKYNPRFWDDLGVGQPSLYLPILGIGQNGGVRDYSKNKVSITLGSGGFTSSGQTLLFSGSGGSTLNLPLQLPWSIVMGITPQSQTSDYGGLLTQNGSYGFFTEEAVLSVQEN